MLYEIVRWIHIGAGAVSLLSLGVPLAAKKGGPLHVRAGWIYAWAMGTSAVTGAIVAGAKIPDAATRNGGVFLMFVALLSATTTVHGLRALRHKGRKAPVLGVPEVGLPAVLVAAGLGMAGWGLAQGVGLFTAFGVLGVWAGGNFARWWARPPSGPKDWLMQHIAGMIASGIGTVTAFLVVNAGRMDLPVPGWVVWLAPTFLGVPAIVAWQRSVGRPRLRAASPASD